MASKFKWSKSVDGATETKYNTSYSITKETSPDFGVSVSFRDSKWGFRIFERKANGISWSSNKRFGTPSTAKKHAIPALYQAMGDIYKKNLRKLVNENLEKGVLLIMRDGQKLEVSVSDYSRDKALSLSQKNTFGAVTPEDIKAQINVLIEGGELNDIGWEVYLDLTL